MSVKSRNPPDLAVLVLASVTGSLKGPNRNNNVLADLTCRKSILARPPTNRLMPGFSTKVRGTTA